MEKLQHDIASYERWLRKQCAVVEADLETKHERMRESAFDFLRATYFRWARCIDTICPGLTKAPKVLSVGDTHVENFGTWRDAQARLVWGVNDFDDAATMPYVYDLVRLAASAVLAPTLQCNPRQAAAAVLRGYKVGLGTRQPTLIDENADWLRPLVATTTRAVDKFWREVERYPDASPPDAVRKALRRSLPKGAEVMRFASRTKGSGSLGRPRFLVIARWQCGHIVREAKALAPSAWHWAHGKGHARNRFLDLGLGQYRSPDPELCVKAKFVLRRVSPDTRKIELQQISALGLGPTLLEAMGADLGTVHASHMGGDRIVNDLRKRSREWLYRAVTTAVQCVQCDFAEFGRQRKQTLNAES